MEIQKTVGIVLSAKEYGEADIITRIITRDYGKRSFVFKGLKKTRKRARSAAEPGACTHLVYYFHGERDAYTVSDFTVAMHYPEIREDLDKIFHLFFLLESVDKTTGFNDSDLPVYELLAAGIDALSGTAFPAHLTSFFLIRLLGLHGILHGADACKYCGSTDFAGFTLDINDLRPVCDSCAVSESMLDRSVMDYMTNAARIKFSGIDHAAYSRGSIMDLLFYLSLFIENYFHIILKSKEFILSQNSTGSGDIAAHEPPQPG